MLHRANRQQASEKNKAKSESSQNPEPQTQPFTPVCILNLFILMYGFFLIYILFFFKEIFTNTTLGDSQIQVSYSFLVIINIHLNSKFLCFPGKPIFFS